MVAVANRMTAWKSGAPAYEWVDGYRYGSSDGRVALEGCSICLDFFPVIEGHSIRIYRGEGSLTAVPYAPYFTSDKVFARNSFSQNSASPTRIVPEGAKFIRVCAITDYKDYFYIYDVTDGVYIAKGKFA